MEIEVTLVGNVTCSVFIDDISYYFRLSSGYCAIILRTGSVRLDTLNHYRDVKLKINAAISS